MRALRAVLLVALGLGLGLGAWNRLQPSPVAEAERAPSPTPAALPEPLPPAAWSGFFRDAVAEGRWNDLRNQLLAIQRASPETFRDEKLGYLLSRAALQVGDLDLARRELAPFRVAPEPWRRLARYQDVRLAEREGADRASAARRALLADYPADRRADEVLETELAWLELSGTPEETFRFVEEAQDTLPERFARDLQARLVEVFAAQQDWEAAASAGNDLLADGIGDDAAERTALALDRPPVLGLLDAEQLARVGEALRSHRHFDRAVEVLGLARRGLPSRRAELDFSIGRAHFFAESYEAAIQAYLRGAANATSPAEESRFYFHASRAAQLLGDDERGLELLDRAIRVPGRHPATVAALGNRLKTRLHQGRLEDARRNLELVRAGFPNDEEILDSSLVLAAALLAAGRPDDALETLDRIPRRLLGTYAPSEIAYWKGRAQEHNAPELAVRNYLAVLRATAATHFAHFARERLDRPELADAARDLAEEKREAAEAAIAAGDLDAARRLATEAWLLAPHSTPDQLARLAAIYRALPEYAEVLDLESAPFPAFPLSAEADATDRLMAMGLFDDVVPEIGERYPLSSLPTGLARAEAYRLAGAGRASIGTAESLMKQVPDDFAPPLLPSRLRELLYPRPFLDIVRAEAREHGADPRLMLAIMREESRFDPRAKSAAAARGLMQFVITTARDVGAEVGLAEVRAQDLYEPRIGLRLGARYVGSLLDAFEHDPYAAAAAFNAGPYQARLWRRLQPAPGDDVFLTSVSFDETKNYVRKVLNAYDRYGELYGEAPAPARLTAGR